MIKNNNKRGKCRATNKRTTNVWTLMDHTQGKQSVNGKYSPKPAESTRARRQQQNSKKKTLQDWQKNINRRKKTKRQNRNYEYDIQNKPEPKQHRVRTSHKSQNNRNTKAENVAQKQ